MHVRIARIPVILFALVIFLPPAPAAGENDDKPNIVLVLMDNCGCGEVGVYGGDALRGAPTPAVIERIPEHLGGNPGSVDPAHPGRAPPKGDRLV